MILYYVEGTDQRGQKVRFEADTLDDAHKKAQQLFMNNLGTEYKVHSVYAPKIESIIGTYWEAQIPVDDHVRLIFVIKKLSYDQILIAVGNRTCPSSYKTLVRLGKRVN